MYGTLLDQRVFESLVEKTMPILWDHLVKSDVQLSVVSLPWFLSLYINSMPLTFAFRVLDVFFMEGPKVLFQVGLAILRINGEDLLDATDDGAFISVLKNYFSRLDESAHPNSANEKLRALTKFQELIVVAFKEFAGITQNTISEQRTKHKDAVLDNIENFAKRTSIRNLGPDAKRLNPDDLSILYNRFYGVLYERQQRMQSIREETDRRSKAGRSKTSELITGIATHSAVEVGRVGLGPSLTLMDYDAFRELLAGMADWACTDSPRSLHREQSDEKENHGFFGDARRSQSVSLPPWGAVNPEPADHDFMRRLFCKWDKGSNSSLSLQNVVSGLAQVKGTRDMMTSISYFFELYDDDGDGKVDREGILRISEALLFLSRRGLAGDATSSHPVSVTTEAREDGGLSNGENSGGVDEKFLGSVSAFIRRCFEYADPDHAQNEKTGIPGDGTQLGSRFESFSIGDDDDEDLLDLEGDSSSPSLPNASSPNTIQSPATSRTPAVTGEPGNRGNAAISDVESANLALDPANPLHITLPTFRMVILADEMLERFFESFFPNSFILSDSHTSAVSSTSNRNLTTFSNMASNQALIPNNASLAPGSILPPGKGLRGVLDNIVTDGMRVAAEVRRRMDEAQREMERNALGRDEEDEGEEGEDNSRIASGYSGDAETRSVKDSDRDLLEGAEADAGHVKDKDLDVPRPTPKTEDYGSLQEPRRKISISSSTEKVIEFER
ncbi:MAG: hypothetical protein M1835_007568 [Candelina submexicana]|nr:MAG: hypothetical protein M1835_007568 [Candelina submexicana]